MSPRKIVYQDWIVEISADPALKHRYSPPRMRRVSRRLIGAVRMAISTLTPPEREFVHRYYYDGQSNRVIAAAMRKRVEQLDRFHRRILRRLRNVLADFVAEEYGLAVDIGKNCPICNSRHCDEINRLILTRPPKATWRGVLRILRDRYGLDIKSPQVLIGHQRYHMKKGVTL